MAESLVIVVASMPELRLGVGRWLERDRETCFCSSSESGLIVPGPVSESALSC